MSADAPTSPSIRWAGYFAWLMLAMIPLAVLTVRSGRWQEGLTLYALAGLISLALLALFAVFSLLPRWSDQRASILRHALPALPGALLFLAAMLGGGQAPPIHDISTDTQDPPRFEKAPSLRGDDSNPLTIEQSVFDQQRAAYPDIDTIESPRAFASSYNLALGTARDLGWEITREDPNAGYIEAVDTTAFMQFKDDIVIRVRTNAEGSIVDLRSVSRVGRSDLGANAERIRTFRHAFLDAARG